MEFFVSNRSALALAFGGMFKLLWHSESWPGKHNNEVWLNFRPYIKKSAAYVKVMLWGPKTTPLFSENENVSDDNVLLSLNVSALQNHCSLGFLKYIYPLQGIFLHNINVPLFCQV